MLKRVFGDMFPDQTPLLGPLFYIEGITAYTNRDPRDLGTIFQYLKGCRLVYTNRDPENP